MYFDFGSCMREMVFTTQINTRVSDRKQAHIISSAYVVLFIYLLLLTLYKTGRQKYV